MKYLSAPHPVEMTEFEDLSTDEILQMDKLSPEEMLKLSELTRKSDHDKTFHAWELERDNKVKDLENELMDMLIAMTTSGATGTESRVIIQKKQRSVQKAKAYGKQQKVIRVQNWTERTDLCNKFRQELLSMRINALPKQGVPAASGEPLKARPKGRFWGMRSSNPFAVEEIDQ